jgi:ParB/RepB/Spo0J family partition protein
MQQEINVKDLDMGKIVPSPFNSRKTFDPVKLEELAASIKQKGVINMILVRPVNGKYEIVCGERRFRASKMCGMKTIPGNVREMSDQEALEFQVIENLQRDDIHPLEEAEGYEMLIKKHGYKNADDLAVKVGKTRAYIYSRLKLLDLVPANRKLFYEGLISPSVALLIARIPDHLQVEAGRKLSVGPGAPQISYRDAVEFITKEFMLRLKEASFDTDDPLLTDNAGSCTLCTKRTGNQKELFPDVSSADVCTDPVCFKSKALAFVNKTLAKAKVSGKKVLTEREAKKVFPQPASILDPSDGYLNINTRCAEDPQGRTYANLMSKKLSKDGPATKTVIAINPHDGKMVTLITKKEAAALRKKLGIKAQKSGKASDQGKKRLEAAKAREEEKARRAAVCRIVSEVIKRARSDKEMSFAQLMAHCVLDTATDGAKKMFVISRDPETKADQVDKAIEDHLTAISGGEFLLFCLEIILLGEAEWGGYGDTALELCNHYGIDTARLKKPFKLGGEIKAPVDETKASGGETEAPTVETPPATEEKAPASVKEPEKVKIKKRDSKTFEFKGKAGKKVVVKSKEDMSFDDSQKAGEAISQVIDMLSGEGK